MIVYMIQNKINGKAYIGMTTRALRLRMKGHRHDVKVGCTGMAIHRAIRKYGWENFDITILCRCATEVELRSAEIRFIAEHNTRLPNGYNLSDGGVGCLGYIMNDEQRARRSRNTLKAQAEGRVPKGLPDGYRHSDEAKRKMSAAAKKRIARFNHLITPEAITKRQATKRAQRGTPEQIAKMRAGGSSAKLSDRDVADIRYMMADGFRNHELAKQYNVDAGYISVIRTGTERNHPQCYPAHYLVGA